MLFYPAKVQKIHIRLYLLLVNYGTLLPETINRT